MMDCLFIYLKIFRLGPYDRIQLMGIVQSHGPLLSLHQALLHQKRARIFFSKGLYVVDGMALLQSPRDLYYDSSTSVSRKFHEIFFSTLTTTSHAIRSVRMYSLELL